MIVLHVSLLAGISWAAPAEPSMASAPAIEASTSALQGPAAGLFPSRLMIHNSMLLPSLVFLNPDFNRDARLIGVELELDLRCTEERATRRRFFVRCDVAQAAVRGTPMRGDERAAEIALAEARDKLLVSRFDLRVDREGRVRDVALRGGRVNAQENQRTRRSRELIRLFAMRSMAGLDLAVGDRATTHEVWSNRARLLLDLPYAGGTMGSLELVHRSEVAADGSLVVRSTGVGAVEAAGLVVPSGRETLRIETEAWTILDPDTGHLLSRAWRSEAWPTAGAPSAERGVGRPYLQAGVLLPLADDAPFEVGRTGVAPPNLAWKLTPLGSDEQVVATDAR